jgi:protein-S-isoprenylcysteine O-methyltransferase Ste14
MHLPSLSVLGGLYGFSELLLALVKSAKRRSDVRDRGSLSIIWGVIVTSVIAAHFAPSMFTGCTFSKNFYPYGCGVYFCGLIGRWYAILYLGRFFTVDVAIHGDHRVVDSGPYRLVRHPSYFGALLAFFGLGVCFLNWVSILVMFVPITSAFLYRIRVEESALIESLGNAYLEYSARTKRIIPFVY